MPKKVQLQEVPIHEQVMTLEQLLLTLQFHIESNHPLAPSHWRLVLESALQHNIQVAFSCWPNDQTVTEGINFIIDILCELLAKSEGKDKMFIRGILSKIYNEIEEHNNVEDINRRFHHITTQTTPDSF